MGPEIQAFVQGMVGSSLLEWTGAALGFIAVVLTIRRSVWNYLFGIPCVIIYAWLFYEWQLYSQVLLYIYYIGMLAAGVYWWLNGRAADGLVVIERSPTGEFLALVVAVGLAIPALGWLMETQFGARLAFLDAATTCIAAGAQYLQSRRRVETYAVWMLVNVLSILLFYQSGNPPTMALYAIYLALSVWGVVAWTRAWRSGARIAV
ncbi:MAG: nicotinamide riboside transporter PnuC [Pseudomonadota bacterium]